MRLTTTANISSRTTTKPRPRARYIDWSTLFQANNFLNPNMPKSFVIPQNIADYSQWVKRQKRVCILIKRSYLSTLIFFSNLIFYLVFLIQQNHRILSILHYPIFLISLKCLIHFLPKLSNFSVSNH